MRADFSRVSEQNKKILESSWPDSYPHSLWNLLTPAQRYALFNCDNRKEVHDLLFPQGWTPKTYTPHFKLSQVELGHFMIMLTGQFSLHSESEIFEWFSIHRNCGIVFASYQLDKIREVLFDTDKTKEQKYREICSWFN